ncbi:MAG: hypothetical protein AABN34_22925 [Acidobacteriota bacterium]
MSFLTQTEITQTLPAVSSRTIVFASLAIVALTLVAFGTVVWWRREKRRKGEAQRDRSDHQLMEVISEEVLSRIQSEIEPLRGRLEDLEKLITTCLAHHEKQELANVKLKEIHEELSEIPRAIGRIPDLLREVLVKCLGRDRAENDKEINGATKELINGAKTKLDALLDQYHVSQVSTLVRPIIQDLEKASQSWEKFEKDFSPYLHVAKKIEELRGKLDGVESSQQIPLEEIQAGTEAELESLRSDLEALVRNHRPLWFVDLIEEAGRYPSLHEAAESLKEALDLEEIQISLGSELRDIEDVEVVGTEGMGRMALISEVVENGYRQKETGALLRKPKVKVTLEG